MLYLDHSDIVFESSLHSFKIEKSLKFKYYFSFVRFWKRFTNMLFLTEVPTVCFCFSKRETIFIQMTKCFENVILFAKEKKKDFTIK